MLHSQRLLHFRRLSLFYPLLSRNSSVLAWSLGRSGARARRWLTSLITELKSNGFTTLVTLNPQMHPSQELQAILDLFEGEINLYEKETEKGSEKFLRIKKMANQRYLKDELLLKEEDTQKWKKQLTWNATPHASAWIHDSRAWFASPFRLKLNLALIFPASFPADSGKHTTEPWNKHKRSQPRCRCACLVHSIKVNITPSTTVSEPEKPKHKHPQ